jgi:ribosome-associated protein
VQNSRDAAFALARILADHKGGDVVVLDLAPCQGWTDFFLVATATSSAHLRGLTRAVDEWAHEAKVSYLTAPPRVADDEAWVLVDLGDIVIHLMTAEARAFYELEKLWFQATATQVAPEPAKE